jgi:hypothetical protein
MRTRITRALFTAAAAGATIITLGFAAASPAGAVAAGHHNKYFTPSAPQTATDTNCAAPGVLTGTWTSSDCGKVGYVATGRDFRFAQALVTVPNRASTAADPMLYVALDASSTNNDYARAGIESDGAGGWQSFVDIEEPGAPGVFDSAPLAASNEGDGVLISVYFNQVGNSVHVLVTPPNGAGINNTYSVTGPVYTDAQAFGDWTNATQPGPATPGSNTRVTQFFQGRFTTESGKQGTFHGPWELTAVDATSNGSMPPYGTMVGQPSYLWNDGNSYRGLGDDAFGVWLYS